MPRLSVLHLNVLHDANDWLPLVGAVTQSPSRFAHQLERFARMAPDFVCLCEVTHSYLAMLRASAEVAAAFPAVLCGDLEPHGCVVLARRRPVAPAREVPLEPSAGRAAVAAAFELPAGGGRLAVVSAHLSALDTPARAEARRRQTAALTHAVLALARDERCDRGAVVCGDFNYHRAAEGPACLDASTTLDVWAALHGEGGGDTYDARRNPLIRRIRFWESRCMRLDRVLLVHPDGAGAPRLPRPDTISLCFHDEAVALPPPATVWEALRRAAAFPVTLGRGVMPSDHFGLLSRFTY